MREWIERRWPLSALFRVGTDEDIVGGASVAYTPGSATLIVFLVLVVTGVAQLLYYVPTVDHAYDSVAYIRSEVPFGWLLHGLHYWSATAMVILIGLHILRVFIWGAYKRPRELIWILGVGLLLTTVGLSFTGAPLPWNQAGYWAAEVGTSMAGTVPVLGDAVKRLLRGGESMGQLTLSRFFVLHVAVLPAVLMFLVILHLVAFRRFGSVGPWTESRRKRSEPFWPRQAFLDIVVAASILAVLVLLSYYFPPAHTGPADPADTSYVPRPEWNFLFLYEALKFLPGRLEPIGTVGLPLLIVIGFVLVPFVDHHRQRNPLRRPLAMALGLSGVVLLLGLTAMGFTRRRAVPSAPVASVAHLSGPALSGRKLVDSLGCLGCHQIQGAGATVGPDLSNEALRGRTEAWLATQIRDPKAHDPGSIMPPFKLSAAQTDEVVAYLESLGRDVASR